MAQSGKVFYTDIWVFLPFPRIKMVDLYLKMKYLENLKGITFGKHANNHIEEGSTIESDSCRALLKAAYLSWRGKKAVFFRQPFYWVQYDILFGRAVIKVFALFLCLL